MEDKQEFQLLADAATLVQIRRLTRTSSALYVVLACSALLVAAFPVPGRSVLGWLICAMGLAVTGVYGITVSNPESVLFLQTGVAAAVAVYSAYRAFRGPDGFGIVFALLAARLVFAAVVRLRAYRSAACTPLHTQELVRAFIQASRAVPSSTPGLIALRRPSSLWSTLTKRYEDYDYRLLLDGDLVFLIGVKSFLGLHYSPLIRRILPLRSCHIDVVASP